MSDESLVVRERKVVRKVGFIPAGNELMLASCMKSEVEDFDVFGVVVLEE